MTDSIASSNLWEMESHQVLKWLESLFFPAANQNSQNREAVMTLFGYLIIAIDATKAVETAFPKGDNKTSLVLQDPFRIWFEAVSEWETLPQPLPANTGEKLSGLTVAGLINGLAGLEGGVLDRTASLRLPREEVDEALKSASGMGMREVKEVALALHQATQTKLQLDHLRVKSAQIQNMICPDLEASKLEQIRLRVRSEVERTRTTAANGEEVPATLSKARTVLPAEERDFICPLCGNQKQSLFVLDRKSGDIICTNCGLVTSERIIHQGAQYRTFEGEADRNTNGATYNPLFSNAYNTATGLTRGVFSTPGSSAPGGGNRGSSYGLRKVRAYIELNLCHLGEDEKRKSNSKKHETRVGYKDQQKKQAFARMQHVGDALDLNVAVLELAKALFSKFRDNRQVLKEPEGVIAACICEAYDQVSLDGRKFLEAELEKLQTAVVSEHWPSLAASACTKSSRRAMRRRIMHTTHMASSNGGCLSGVRTADSDTAAAPKDAATNLERKPVSSWDLNDTRTWLLCAAKGIVQYLQQQQGKGSGITLEELEGDLMGHAFLICECLDSNNRHCAQCGSSEVPVSVPAGKKLLLMNANKFFAIVNDKAAAQAFHQKLRGVVNKQAARRSHAIRQKASQVRFQQMKRRHWVEEKARSKAIGLTKFIQA